VTLIYALIWGSWVVFGIVTVWALAWAVRSGQFQQSLSEGDEVIFDDDEPVGEMTDTFPDVSPADITTDAEEEQRD
jgi:nitrogen fixation-related uncharacterized protein